MIGRGADIHSMDIDGLTKWRSKLHGIYHIERMAPMYPQRFEWHKSCVVHMSASDDRITRSAHRLMLNERTPTHCINKTRRHDVICEKMLLLL